MRRARRRWFQPTPIVFDAVTVPGGIWHSAPGQMAFYVLPTEARFEQVRALRRVLPDRIELVGIVGAVMSANYSEGFCVALMERPDEVDGWARKTLENGLADGRRLLDCGCGAIVTASDIADNRGALLQSGADEASDSEAVRGPGARVGGVRPSCTATATSMHS